MEAYRCKLIDSSVKSFVLSKYQCSEEGGRGVDNANTYTYANTDTDTDAGIDAIDADAD